jgi:hypothetical protein
MDRAHILRRLRIAFSAVCGIVCLVLAVFWARSYSHEEHLQFQAVYPKIFVHSVPGILCVGVTGDTSPGGGFKLQAQSYARVEDQMQTVRLIYAKAVNARGFGAIRRAPSFVFLAPYWFYVSLATIAAALPWLRWSFSLRTLLIATTLVAIVLGLVVALR